MSQKIRDGIVTRGHGNRFVVYSDGRHYDCQLRKKVKFRTEETTPVAVGDEVSLTIFEDGTGVIEEVRERKSVLSRPAVGRETREHVLAANIDALIIVVSVVSPPLKPGLIDRFLIAASIGRLHPVIVVNKIDLGFEKGDEEAIGIYGDLEYETILTSAVDGRGLDRLRRSLSRHRGIMAGHSGVGKSTLLNKLLPDIDLPTREISSATGRGRHTTSHMELFHLPDGGFVIDSPGIKALGLWQFEKKDLVAFYPEMRPFADNCRFTNCSHIHEPDCAVQTAVERGDISKLRYHNYKQIYDSL